MTVPATATPTAPAAAAPTPVTVPPVTQPAGAAATPATPPAASPAPVAPATEPKPSLLGDVKPPDGDAPKKEEPAPVKPDYSKLKLPDGSKLQPSDVDAFRAAAEKRGLSPEAAQQELEERSSLVQGYHDSLLAQHQQSVAANRKVIEAHPKFGGANLKATNEAVTQVMERFAPKGLMEEMQSAGFNWNPKVLEMLVNIHEATKTDTFVPSGGTPAIPQPKGLESMYKS